MLRSDEQFSKPRSRFMNFLTLRPIALPLGIATNALILASLMTGNPLVIAIGITAAYFINCASYFAQEFVAPYFNSYVEKLPTNKLLLGAALMTAADVALCLLWGISGSLALHAASGLKLMSGHTLGKIALNPLLMTGIVATEKSVALNAIFGGVLGVRELRSNYQLAEANRRAARDSEQNASRAANA